MSMKLIAVHREELVMREKWTRVERMIKEKGSYAEAFALVCSMRPLTVEQTLVRDVWVGRVHYRFGRFDAALPILLDTLVPLREMDHGRSLVYYETVVHIVKILARNQNYEAVIPFLREAIRYRCAVHGKANGVTLYALKELETVQRLAQLQRSAEEKRATIAGLKRELDQVEDEQKEIMCEIRKRKRE